MRNRIALRYMVSILALVTILLAGCEKERPPLTPSASSTTPAAANQTPGAAQTQVALPSPVGGQATPLPLLASTATPPPPKSAESSSATSGGGTTLSDETSVYTVQAGDSLASIARDFDTTVQEILTFNPIVDPDVLEIGQELRIPGASGSGTSSTSTDTSSTETTEVGETGDVAPTGDTGAIYVVQSGDTLAAIASRFGMTQAELQQLNGITDPDQIYVGEELTVAGGTGAGDATGEEESAGSESTTYVVQRGDTLFSIAVAHGVTVTALKSANDIADENQIYVGQVLTIP